MKQLTLFSGLIIGTALVFNVQTTAWTASGLPGANGVTSQNDIIPAKLASAASKTDCTWSVVERGPHHRVWERIEYESAPEGRQIPRPHRYIELATGMHYWEDGQWKESRELIEPYPGGAVAQHGQHKVIFAYNLATLGAIDMELPDGKRLRSHVLGLSYFDTASGKSVLIAGVKDCTGVIVEPNQVLYADAFDGLRADVRYTYTRAGFEQDIILHERPLGPEAYGLDPATTRLQVWTEFVQAPKPGKARRAVRSAKGHQVDDEALDFGAMYIGSGKAFTLGEGGVGSARQPLDTGHAQALLTGHGVPVGKQWVEVEDRQFLVEEVPVPAVQMQLGNLPRTLRPAPSAAKLTLQQLASRWPRYSSDKKQIRPDLPSLQLTSAKAYRLERHALVLDYVAINSTLTNYTFQSNATYYITDVVALHGTTTLQRGTVLKFPEDGSGLICAVGAVVCETAPHRPAVFTSANDDSIGETVRGSTGEPATGLGTYLSLDCGLENCRFSYAGIGISVGTSASQVFNGMQFLDCDVCLVSDLAPKVKNSLVNRCGMLADGGVECENVTFDQCTYVAGSDMYLTNCIFASVAQIGRGTNCVITGANNGFYNSPVFGESTFVVTNYPFQSSTIVNLYLDTAHYLSCASLRDKGDRTASQGALYHYTTSADQMREAGSIVDLGYHYLALSADGEPFDADGDGTPDYIEDQNGNGTADAGEPDSNRYVVISHPLDSDLPESDRRRVVQQSPGGANRWLATFTPGACTVILAGPARTNFQEVHLGTTYWVYLNSTNNPGGTDLCNTNLPGIWVRTLPEPFDGTIPTYWLDAALAANNNGVDDILAIAWQYIAGAEPAPTWENYGTQDRGDARYGPLKDLNCTGPCERYPGGDFNDYLGIPVYWPPPDNFTAYPKYNPACTNNFDCRTNNYAFSLDCSGFVRMVFGYRHNMEGLGFSDRVPLCYGTNAAGLPRRADWQFNSGPGVVIIPHTPDTVPTNFTKMQIGDLVFFEYPNTATYDYDADYEIDHVGIYLGPGKRTGGYTYHYFISSRAKLNGPTIGSAATGWGGQSILNGNPNTFYWTGAYRCVRRL